MEMCGAAWYKDGAYYMCNSLKNHGGAHDFSFHSTNDSSYAQPDYKTMYEESQRLRAIDIQKTKDWMAIADTLEVQLRETVRNNAIELSELEKSLDVYTDGTFTSLRTEMSAVKKENNSLREELKDLRENFAYNENSWRESNTNLKNELTTANDTIADYKAVIKQKSEALDRASELLRKVRRFIRDVGL